MLDVLPPESARWIDVVSRFALRAERFGYGLLLTPIVEHYEVFARVVRPEGTAPVVRAFVQHRPPTPWKVWYLAPNFRAEQPQAGRYRQHWQLGAEVIGIDDPDVDVELIELLWGFCRDLGLSDVSLLVNSMGDAETRSRYRDVLLEYWRAHESLLGAEMERAEANPLRILDSKRSDWLDMLERAPQLGEYLTDESAAHFARVQEGLQALGIPFEIAPRLVRGFDYYTSTVFELTSEALDAAQNAIGGGGRYDRLAQEMGGPAAPSIGFGTGIERLLLACDAEGVLPVPAARVDAFVVDLVGVGVADTARLLAELRESGLAADRAYGGRSPKRQFAQADRSGARWAVIIGADEALRGMVAVKDLRSEQPQCEVHREEIAAWLLTRKDEATS